LGKIPILGAVFGGTSRTTSKTELIILITPRVVYDETEVVTMSNELRDRMKRLRSVMLQN
jgi:general secretion pathway protein D